MIFVLPKYEKPIQHNQVSGLSGITQFLKADKSLQKSDLG
jgi:hypothetical protein